MQFAVFGGMMWAWQHDLWRGVDLYCLPRRSCGHGCLPLCSLRICQLMRERKRMRRRATSCALSRHLPACQPWRLLPGLLPSHHSRGVLSAQEPVPLGASGGRPWMDLALQGTARQQYEVTIAAKHDPIQAKRMRVAGVLS